MTFQSDNEATWGVYLIEKSRPKSIQITKPFFLCYNN